MCLIHCTRTVLRNIPRKHQKEVAEGAEGLKDAYGDEQNLQDIADDLNAGDTGNQPILSKDFSRDS